MRAEAAAGPKGRLAVGVVFMTVGLLAALAQAGILEFEGFGRWWPLLLIGVGVVKVLQPIENGQRGSGIVFLVLGGVFEVVNVLAWRNAWPLLMVLGGALVFWRGIVPSPRDSAGRCRGLATVTTPLVSLVALLGGIRRSVVAPDFEGGYLTAVMGGIELDLREARIATSPVRLDVLAMLGGIEIKVPTDWIVEGGVSPLMGGFENKARVPLDAGAAPRLILRGYVVMGGVTVEN
jgi:hypothetical protein